MKLFTVITALFSVGILFFSEIHDVYAVYSPEIERDKILIKFRDKIVNLPKGIRSGDMAASVTCPAVKIAPVFDSSGAVVSDPSGTMSILNQSGFVAVLLTCPEMKIAPVFDSTGVVVSDPNGTLLNANHFRDLFVLLTGLADKIAPVFDDTGRIVSDPTGTILSLIYP